MDRMPGAVALLDVDGVVSRLSGPVRASSRLRLETAVADRVRRLTALVEVVWVTAWDAGTRGTIEATFGLPRLRAIEVAEPETVLSRVAAWIDRSAPPGGWRAVVWIDDVLLGDAVDWAAARPFPVELIRPDPMQGLRDEHVDRAEAFLAGLPR